MKVNWKDLVYSSHQLRLGKCTRQSPSSKQSIIILPVNSCVVSLGVSEQSRDGFRDALDAHKSLRLRYTYQATGKHGVDNIMVRHMR